ncbi:hypothetical protein CASFOL_004767 [Castilleja foliolosa]|uniref:Pentatricopeptide repeat-containing protein n=1 Tax=Castilleja foliolosa TaxID=1961234 RepID=A0ABD3EBE6_9LAMI
MESTLTGGNGISASHRRFQTLSSGHSHRRSPLATRRLIRPLYSIPNSPPLRLKYSFLGIVTDSHRPFSNHLLANKLTPLSSDVISLDSSNPNLECSIGKSDIIAAANVDNISPNTLAFLLKSFASSDQLESGKTVHGQIIKLGFVADTFVMNSLLEFYIHFLKDYLGLIDIRRVFEEMPERDIVSWNNMISCFVNRTMNYEALLVFDDMLSSSEDHHRYKPDETTLVNMLLACSGWDGFIEQAEWLGNALIEMFVRYNDLGNAKMVFKSMSKRCILTWELMFSGLLCNGFWKETLMLFDTRCCCSEGGLKPNEDIFNSVLFAFEGDVSLVGDGKRLVRVIHKIVHGFGVKPNEYHYELMVKVIAKAGWIEAAMMLAESLPWTPNHVLWGYLLYECQIHRFGDDLLLDSLIQKIDVVQSKKPAHEPPFFWMLTMMQYIFMVSEGKPNNDVIYARLMVSLLLRKFSDRDLNLLVDLQYLGELYKYMENILTLQDDGDAYSTVHAQETLLSYEDDVYKVVESLHSQMSNNIDDPCQLAVYF